MGPKNSLMLRIVLKCRFVSRSHAQLLSNCAQPFFDWREPLSHLKFQGKTKRGSKFVEGTWRGMTVMGIKGAIRGKILESSPSHSPHLTLRLGLERLGNPSIHGLKDMELYGCRMIHFE